MFAKVNVTRGPVVLEEIYPQITQITQIGSSMKKFVLQPLSNLCNLRNLWTIFLFS